MSGARRMLGALIAGALVLADGAVSASELIAVPSGQPILLGEMLIDDSEGETWLRFRFIAPRSARDLGEISAQDAAQDMDVLCADFALPYMAQYQLTAARVVVSLSERNVPFGAFAPEVTQYFEAYRPEGDSCILEEF